MCISAPVFHSSRAGHVLWAAAAGAAVPRAARCPPPSVGTESLPAEKERDSPMSNNEENMHTAQGTSWQRESLGIANRAKIARCATLFYAALHFANERELCDTFAGISDL